MTADRERLRQQLAEALAAHDGCRGVSLHGPGICRVCLGRAAALLPVVERWAEQRAAEAIQGVIDDLVHRGLASVGVLRVLRAHRNALSARVRDETPVAGVSRSTERDAGFVTQRNDGNGADHDTTEGPE